MIKGKRVLIHLRMFICMSLSFSPRNYGVVILDESHYIKNEKAARTKAVVPVCQAAKRVMLLSGELMVNDTASSLGYD